jgi:hypothetical protein
LQNPGNGTKALWLNELKRVGFKPNIVALDTAENIDEATRKEKWWITHGSYVGWKLTNDVVVRVPVVKPPKPEKPPRIIPAFEPKPEQELSKPRRISYTPTPTLGDWELFAQSFFVQNPDASQRALTRAMAEVDPDKRPPSAFVGGLSSDLFHRYSPKGSNYKPPTLTSEAHATPPAQLVR